MSQAPIDLCVAALGAMQIGRFRCRPDDPKFANSGPIRGWLLVFPRTSVWIRHAGKSPVLADPSRVMLYNRGQEYTADRLFAYRAITQYGSPGTASSARWSVCVSPRLVAKSVV